MIIQCDQCKTKFRLDDSKVSEKGAKVRCAKCKHIFMVQRETPVDEPDFDFLLSGLGASTYDAGSGVLHSDEAVSPAGGGEEWPGSALGADSTTGSELGEIPATDGMSMTGQEEFGADFFSRKDEAIAHEDSGIEFGEFPFAEENAATQHGATSGPKVVSDVTVGFDFGEFPFTEETAEPSGTSPVSATIPTKTEDFDFRAAVVEMGESAAQNGREGWGGVAADGLEERPFTFGVVQTGLQAADKGLELKPESSEAEEAFDFGSLVAPPQREHEVEPAPFFVVEEKNDTDTEALGFGDFHFGETIVTRPEMTKKEEAKPGNVSPESVTIKPFMPSFASQTPSAEEELPPLATTSRRKGNSSFPVAATVIAVLIVMVIAGAGIYVFTEGPAAFEKLGLTSLAKWSGLKVVEEGGIVVKDLQGVFLINQTGGEIFAISGEAVNNYKKPRASIQVKATILGPKGETLVQKSAYCGNILSKEQLATLPMAKIEEAMGSPFGDSLANLGVQPGKGIPFVIVFSGVPKDAAEFSVEVAGSTVASQ